MAQIAIHVNFLYTAFIAHKLRREHVKRSAAGIGRALRLLLP